MSLNKCLNLFSAAVGCYSSSDDLSCSFIKCCLHLNFTIYILLFSIGINENTILISMRNPVWNNAAMPHWICFCLFWSESKHVCCRQMSFKDVSRWALDKRHDWEQHICFLLGSIPVDRERRSDAHFPLWQTWRFQLPYHKLSFPE